VIAFRVHGIPAPQGSKRHVGNGVMVESSKKVKPWREAVKGAAVEAQAGALAANLWDLRCEPLQVRVTFVLPRPKGHYGTGRNANLLKRSAPHSPAVKPDIDKLISSTLDAIGEAGIWRDDAQVAEIHAAKTYGDMPGAHIRIRPLAQEATA